MSAAIVQNISPPSPPPPDADDDLLEDVDPEHPSDHVEEKVDKTIKDEETGYLMIQKADGTIVPPEDPSIPLSWKEVWGVVDMQKAEIRLNEFKNQCKVLSTQRKLPHDFELCACIGVKELDLEEAKRCEELYFEMRKQWKKQFPQSKKKNDVPFHEYELMVLADLYEEAYAKFLAQAELHDEGHKPTDRLEHYKQHSKNRREKYDKMKSARLKAAEENRKKRKEAAQKRAREAPAKKADAAAKLVAEGIAMHKKTSEYKTEQKDNQTKIRELLKQYMCEGLSMDEALDKATDEVLG